MKRLGTTALISAIGWLIAAGASAAPLTLAQLDQLNLRLSCMETCGYGREALQTTCLAACPAAGADWDKNLDGSLTRVDHSLANLEYVDNGDGMIGQQICYEGGAVVPRDACGLANCTATRTAAQCADADADGLRAFQETLLGSSDSSAATYCGSGAQCGLGAGNPVAGFGHECRYEINVNRTLCRPRGCTPGTNCTAFHLERVAADREEVIVRLHYDYSPVPATVLDLYVEHTAPALQLMEARPLPLLSNEGKALQVRSVGPGLLRVMVLGEGSSRPVPRGPIIELIFSRTSLASATVGFTDADTAQRLALAPNPGAAHVSSLTNDTLWGTDISVGGATNTGDRLVLHYSFDDASAPLEFEDVRDGQGICNIVASCAAETNQTRRSQLINQYSALQAGRAETSTTIEGVSGTAAYFDGLTDHLELPITLNDPASGAYSAAAQSSSVSTWFYFEGDDGRSDLPSERRILLSHNASSSQLTRYGLMLQPTAGETFELRWFFGDARSVAGTVIATGLRNRVWTHLGMTVNAATRQAEFFVDGRRLTWGSPAVSSMTIGTVATDVFSCPQLPAAPATGITLARQGDVTGGRPPESILFASAKNNLFGIEETDPNGLHPRTVIRTGDSSATDPDYSPVVDRIVYASTASGSREIWISHPDGSNPVQITRNFGDTERGIFAGNPRWAPDGSGIVFESNAFDVPNDDNNFQRVNQIYYIAYNALANTPAIPLAAGGTTTVLDYDTLIATQTVADYRIAYSSTLHRYNTTWLRGAYTEGTTSYLGEIRFTTATQAYEGKRIGQASFRYPLNSSVAAPVTPFTLEPNAEVSLLHAHRSQPFGQPEVVQSFIERKWIDYAPTTQFAVTTTETAGVITTTFRHNANGYAALCWDDNLNNVCDAPENRNGAGGCTVDDCYPSEVHEIFVKYDPNLMIPRLNANGALAVTPNAWISNPTENFEVRQVTTATEGSFIKIEVRNALGGTPIPATQALATITFNRAVGTTGGAVTVERRNMLQQLYRQTNTDAPILFSVATTDLEEVMEARFSPTGTNLLLAGLQNARPVLAVTDLNGTANMSVISSRPMTVSGLDWTRLDRAFPCNWVGSLREPATGRQRGNFRGGLDELRVYSYVRGVDTFLSEYERGHERLVLEERDGQLAPQVNTCASDGDCPSYQLCNAGVCGVVACSMSNPYSCPRGQCTLMPTPSDPNNEFSWVCSAECSAHNECFERECLNGPCRFCDSVTESCNECRDAIEVHGALQIPVVEGCPDRNSFACVEGSCITECYSFENGESQYLCSDLEFCNRGRCDLIAWSWADLAPSSFSGAADMSFHLAALRDTAAISQLYPVEFEAFGMDDFSGSPQVLVQGRVSTADAQVYGGDWFDIGRVYVHNRTNAEAQQAANRYIVHSRWPLTGVRMQLIVPPYENFTNAATGFGIRDNNECEAHITDPLWWTQPGDLTACYRRAPGSDATLGYPVGIPEMSWRRACSELGGGSACGYDTTRQNYFTPGQHAVFISNLRINGTLLPTNELDLNTACSYEGFNVPNDPVTGRRRQLYYGNPALEQSNRRNALYPTATFASEVVDFTSVSARAWALLNCNFAHETPTSPRAEAVWQNFTIVYPTLVSGRITETPNGCTVDVNPGAGGVVREQCFEHSGASFDYLASETQVYRSIELSSFRSSGWDVSEGP